MCLELHRDQAGEGWSGKVVKCTPNVTALVLRKGTSHWVRALLCLGCKLLGNG